MAGHIHIERFVFPSETSSLSDDEWGLALRCLDWAEALVRERGRLAASVGEPFGPYLPAGNWDWSKPQSFELDAAVTNPSTSFELLLRRDRDVIRQLRLYAQAFTGYQLATMAMAHTRGWIRRRLPANLDEFIALIAHLPDPHFERWARLAPVMPPELCAAPPWKFGEMGWLVGDYIVNYDNWVYLQRVALLHEAGILQRLRDVARERRPRILEIGGGYGGLAFLLSRLVPAATYTIVDLPESLAFSSIYLSVLHPGDAVSLPGTGSDIEPDARFCLCPNFLLADLLAVSGPFDLVINTNSMNEMTAAQIDIYCRAIATTLDRNGIFFEHNADANPYGVANLTQLISPHFARVQPCPSSLIGRDLDPGPARLWSAA